MMTVFFYTLCTLYSHAIQPLQVLSLRVIDIDVVFSRLCKLMQDADLPARDGRSTEYGQSELLLGDGL